MLSRGLLNIASSGMKDKVVNKLFKDSWGLHRGAINFEQKSFNQLWKEREK
jgi:L-lactate dehydrogenase complex protein LldF